MSSWFPSLAWTVPRVLLCVRRTTGRLNHIALNYMFKLNFHERLTDLNNRQEHCDMTINAWKVAHPKEYSNFKKRIDSVKEGDLSILLEMFSLMKRCTPPEALTFYQWFESLSKRSKIFLYSA